MSSPRSTSTVQRASGVDHEAATTRWLKRISLATSLYKAAMSGLIDAAKEVKEKGTFTYVDRVISTPDLGAFMKG